MPNQSRQLAAIIFTDIVGYTALMGEDEQKAINPLKINREQQEPTPDTFIIIPSSGLAAGEYGFLNMMMVHGSGMKLSYTVFAFGVD